MQARYTHLISETPFNDNRYMFHYVSNDLYKIFDKKQEFKTKTKERNMSGVGLIVQTTDSADLPEDSFVTGATYTFIPNIDLYLDKYKEQLEETQKHLVI